MRKSQCELTEVIVIEFPRRLLLMFTINLTSKRKENVLSNVNELDIVFGLGFGWPRMSDEPVLMEQVRKYVNPLFPSTSPNQSSFP